MKALRPLAEFAKPARAAVRAVLTDIDDTLTDHGRLPAISYAALERLRAAGLLVIPVTGRPAGWCDLIARQWPVDGVVGENGSLYFRYLEKERRMVRVYARDAATRVNDRVKLDAIRADVLTEIAGAAVASDQAYREADLAIDFCEDVPPLPRAAVDAIVEIFERHGATAKISSIHVNGWFGRYDKLSMARRLLAEAYGVDIEAAREAIVFAGDSPNDAPLFAFFPNAVGVANVLDFADRLDHKPQWVTCARGAAGFAELAAALIEAREGQP
ncbi:MAG: HAD-IIB family hydrolase [Kiloniellales bacterium]